MNEMVDYTSYTGAHIRATFNEKVQVTLEGISWAVRRETIPIYVMGSENPVAFARGKRAITGTMVFSMFDRDELLFSFYPNTYGQWNQYGDMSDGASPWEDVSDDSPNDFDSGGMIWLPELRANAEVGSEPGDGRALWTPEGVGDVVQWRWFSRAPHHLDQIPAFNVTLTMVNEEGKAAQCRLIGCVIINEASGYSMNTQIVEKTCTFFCQDVVPLHPIRPVSNSGVAPGSA
jgi:hypothetical protein